MGVVMVMVISGELLLENVKVIVEDSGYVDFYDEVKFRLIYKFYLLVYLIMLVVNCLVYVCVGYGFKDGWIL